MREPRATFASQYFKAKQIVSFHKFRISFFFTSQNFSRKREKSPLKKIAFLTQNSSVWKKKKKKKKCKMGWKYATKSLVPPAFNQTSELDNVTWRAIFAKTFSRWHFQQFKLSAVIPFKFSKAEKVGYIFLTRHFFFLPFLVYQG